MVAAVAAAVALAAAAAVAVLLRPYTTVLVVTGMAPPPWWCRHCVPLASPYTCTRPSTRTPLTSCTCPHTAPATVLLNPPREGVVELQVLEAARHAQSVIYLSCNPVTLARDLAALETTHHVTDAALFDQFPHTPHAEVGVVLQRQRLTRRPRLTNSFRREADTKPKVKV